MFPISLQKTYVQNVLLPQAPDNITLDVLRLDAVHPVISGNKWFKLQEYLADAKRLGKKTIITFGGAFSNHIVATAAATTTIGLQSIGIIRGEKPKKLSPTLIEATGFGMQLFFVDRESYRQKKIPEDILYSVDAASVYTINEGGYGKLGMLGAAQILKEIAASSYTHIIAAVGTGTTLAGLIEASNPQQQIIGISVLKNNFSLEGEINELLSDPKPFTLLHDFHFGGYAKSTNQLIDFMNDWFRQTGIPTDFVYTGKLFFAVDDLLKKSFFPKGSKLLVVHSGGLQGNRSLPKGTLIFAPN